MGPIMIPAAPNSISPPRVVSNTIRSGILVSLPTRSGRRKLSAVPTTIAHHRHTPTAAPVCPSRIRKITAGTQTRAVPTPGIMDSTAMTAPQNTAPSIPATQNDSPARPPWTMPIINVPFSVARPTEAKVPSRRSLSLADSGVYPAPHRQSPGHSSQN